MWLFKHMSYPRLGPHVGYKHMWCTPDLPHVVGQIHLVVQNHMWYLKMGPHVVVQNHLETHVVSKIGPTCGCSKHMLHPRLGPHVNVQTHVVS